MNFIVVIPPPPKHDRPLPHKVPVISDPSWQRLAHHPIVSRYFPCRPPRIRSDISPYAWTLQQCTLRSSRSGILFIVQNRHLPSFNQCYNFCALDSCIHKMQVPLQARHLQISCRWLAKEAWTPLLNVGCLDFFFINDLCN